MEDYINYSAIDFIKEIYEWYTQLQEYKSIGSIEECKNAVDKYKSKNKNKLYLEI